MNDGVQIRLAEPGQTGANLYNSYHFLTQIAGLYAQAAKYDHHPETRNSWLDLSDGVLLDLGEVFTLWEEVIRRTGGPNMDDAPFAQRIVRSCKRADRILGLMDVWTTVDVWCRVMVRLEKRWAKYIESFVARDPSLASQLKVPLERAKGRMRQVLEMRQVYREEADKMAKTHPRGIEGAY